MEPWLEEQSDSYNTFQEVNNWIQEQNSLYCLKKKKMTKQWGDAETLLLLTGATGRSSQHKDYRISNRKMRGCSPAAVPPGQTEHELGEEKVLQ